MNIKNMKNTWKIYLLALICFVISASEYVIVGVLDQVAASTNISIAEAGQLITVFAIAGAIGTPIAVMIMAKMDRRKVLMISLFLVVLGSIMILVAPNYAFLLLSRIVLAIGAGVFNVTCFTVVGKIVAPERQAGAIATITTGFNAALIIGLPIGRVITAAFGWKAIFVSTGVFSLLAIFAVLSAIPKAEGEASVPLGEQLALLKSPKTLLTLAITFFWIGGYSELYSYITPFLQGVSPMSEEMMSMALLIFGIATLIGNKLGGFLGDKVGISKSLTSSMVVHVIALVLISLFAGSTYVTIALLVIWAIAAWIPAPIQQFNIISLSPEASGIMLSLNSSIMQLGLAAGAGIGGIAVGSSSLFSLSWTAAVLVLITAFVTIASFKVKNLSNNSLATD
ncbi:MFS transporter [Clostridium sp. Maddingley MBC34-26]|nr:MFS transporter [Clostridium sp. Maddingley MBC34-26]